MENNKTDIIGSNINIVKLFILFLGIPFLGYLFYTGNHGNLYAYYLTGYYLIIVLLFSYLVSFLTKFKIGKLILLIFLAIFVKNNLKPIIERLNVKPIETNGIAFQTQLAAVSWIKNDAKDQKFNIDCYVPPVITHSYDYLFRWQNIIQSEKQEKLLYTLYESDSPHPERLKAWLDRQKGIGKVIYEEKFGGITVQRRERFKNEKN